MTLAKDTWLRAPFPWYGGKRRVADDVWQYLGTDCGRYIEPFAGSLGVLLGRPAVRGLEVVNDIDGHLVNAWRSLKHSPVETIGWADDIRSEFDLTARHLWLVNEGAERLRAGLQTDPEWHDVQTAGWWLYGIAMWIGQRFAAYGPFGGDGPWTRAKITRERRPGRPPVQLPHLGSDGQGVHQKLPHLGDDGQGVIAQGIYQLARHLSDRLRHVVICNGDWQRVLTPSAARAASGHTAIFLDPPYDTHEDAYQGQHEPVWDEVIDWCEQAPAAYRIVLCGYHGSRRPSGWQEIAYTAKGTSSGNRVAERMWISPSCNGPLTLDLESVA